MSLQQFAISFSDSLLFASCIFLLFGSIFITIRTKAIQLSIFPNLFRIIRQAMRSRSEDEAQYTILPYKALFTAMSTTLGIGTIAGPVVAIHLGGPGALLGFLFTAFLGSAATYTEVVLALRFRKKTPEGKILGGPMQYLQALLSNKIACWYAVCGSLLMAAWSGTQANQLSAILGSPLMGQWRISPVLSGAVVAIIVLFVLIGGIKRISALSAKLVPLMFILYLGSILWIVFSNVDQVLQAFGLICRSAISPYSMATGVSVGGFVSAMRWGIFKGTQATEAGIGTQTIPHSMAETKNPHEQGLMSMLSTYSAGIIAFLTGIVTLITGTWEDPNLPLGVSMIAASFQAYFSHIGVAIVTISTILFGFGTILGNSYNGSQCFGYIFNGKKEKLYYVLVSSVVFLGSILDTHTVWFAIDLFLAAVALPHMYALMLYVAKRTEIDRQHSQ